jgi:hypothetical protein
MFHLKKKIMPRNFLPKTVELSDEILQSLQKKFSLSDKDIIEIRYWNGPGSPYGGVIINTEPEVQFVCYPYDGSQSKFKEEYDKLDDVENVILTENDLE